MFEDHIQIDVTKVFNEQTRQHINSRRQPFSERQIRWLNADRDSFFRSRLVVPSTTDRGNPCVKANMRSLEPTNKRRESPRSLPMVAASTITSRSGCSRDTTPAVLSSTVPQSMASSPRVNQRLGNDRPNTIVVCQAVAYAEQHSFHSADDSVGSDSTSSELSEAGSSSRAPNSR